MNRPAALIGLLLAILAVVAAWLALGGEDSREAAAKRAALAEVERASAPVAVAEPGASERNEAVAQAPRTTEQVGAPAPQELEWRLVVLDERGAGLPRASAFVLESNAATWESISDAAGVVRAAPADREAQVFVAARGRPLEHFRVPRNSGEHSVALSLAFTSLAGVATVNGAAPGAPLALAFRPSPAPFAELELPAELRRKLDAAARLNVSTDASGHFSVDGARLDWSGEALAPRGHIVRRRAPTDPALRQIPLERPSTALVLEFERLQHLVGRVLDPAGAPAPQGATLRAAVHWEGGRSIASSTAPLDADGRFEVALRDARIDKVELALECDSGQFAQELVGADLRLDARGDLDAGTLVLRPRAALRVRVLDAAGLALAKAKARIVGDSTWSETDANGECLVKSATIGAAELRVVALGHWAEKLPVLLPTDELVEVRLRRSNRLELELVDAAGAPLSHVLVRIESAGEPLFRASGSWLPDGESFELMRGQFAGGGQEVGAVPRGWFDVEPGRDGAIALEGLAPRVALKLSVLDQLGQALLEREFAQLGEEEQRVERVRVDTPLTELTGRVSDASGQPIGGAQLRLAHSDPYGDPLATRSDPSGRYVFRGLSGARVKLEVLAEGFVARRQLDVELRPPASRFDVVLEGR